MDFAKSHMEGKGWSEGIGLGRHGQGITDAIKPKLKFDQSGIGHNKAEEFEFQWWDHAFNKAAKSVKVEADQDGQVKVDFNSSKDELSTKKIRRKAEKAMKKEVKAKLYSNFVKSGTLTGGKMEEAQETDSGFVEDKDLSLLRTLTDEELVKACGGRTAHKGGRHGHRMNAKLARIERAEAEYMENHKLKEQEAISEVEKDVSSRLGEGEAGIEVANIEVKKKKKRKREKDGINDVIPNQELSRCDVMNLVNEEEGQKPKKKKSKKRPTEEDVENEEPVLELKVKKKITKKSKFDIDDSTLEVHLVASTEEESATKKKKKSKKKKLKGGSD